MFWVQNGLQFPSQPHDLKLTHLEERLVAPRIPFMQLREMPRGGQLNLRGNIVNVPADVNSTIKTLPRLLHENETIMLKLKRKLAYKHHVAFENIRPNKVYDAAKWLIDNSSLFKGEGIVLNEKWLQQPVDMQCYDLNTDSVNDDTQSHEEINHESKKNEEEDTWTEDDNFHDRLIGNLDTCLQPADFREFNQIISVAPAEKSSPISLFQDIHAEILAFPSIFCGQQRKDNQQRKVPLH